MSWINYFYLLSIFIYFANGNDLDENLVKKLPKIFVKDNFEECYKNNNKYFEVNIELKPLNESEENPFWNSIKASKNSLYHYDHGLLYHKKCAKNIDDLNKLYNKPIENLGLNSSVKKIILLEKPQFLLGFYELTIVLFLLSYVVLIIYLTIKDCIYNGEKSKGNEFAAAFSLVRNFKKAFGYNKFSETKSIQGCRQIAMLLTIFAHGVSNYLISYIENTEEIEKAFLNPFVNSVMQSGLYAVQLFFFVSSFLLGIQVHEIYESNKKFTLKHAFLLVLNRYLRFIPVIAFVISIFSLVVTTDNTQEFFFENQINLCKTKWFRTLTLTHNYATENICHFGTWYVAADIQLFIATVFIFYVLIKFKLNYKALGILALISLIWHSFLIYSNNHDVTIKITPRADLFRFLTTHSELVWRYKSAISNFPTYILGFYFGYFYFTHKDGTIFRKKIKAFDYWWLVGIAVIAFVSYCASCTFPRVISAIFGPLLKMLVGLSCGIYLLGSIYSETGIPKRILENKFLQITSNINYSMYIIHFAIFFGEYFPDLINISYYFIFQAYLRNLFVSFILALLLCVFVELPMNNLQKMYVPQVSRKIKIESKND